MNSKILRVGINLIDEHRGQGHCVLNSTVWSGDLDDVNS